MIVFPLLICFGMAVVGWQSRANRPLQQVRNSAPSAQRPDESAWQTIKREHAAARFPYIVSSLCRDFLERFPESSYRGDVEKILQRNEAALQPPAAQPRPR